MTVAEKLRLIMDRLSLDGVTQLGEIMEAGEWVRPVADRIVAFGLEERASQHIISVGGSTRPTRFLCVAAGPGAWISPGGRIAGELDRFDKPICAPMPVGPGDVFIAGVHVGEHIKADEIDLRLIKAADVLAVLELSQKPEPAHSE